MIRSATPEDLPSILEIETSSFSGDRFNRRQFRYLMTKAQASFLVQEIDGKVIAYSILFTPRRYKTARIYSIAVHPSGIGRGYGKQMLVHHIELAQKLGFESIHLEVRMDNPVAISLYEKQGFKQIGTHPGYYEDGTGAKVYRKPLVNLDEIGLQSTS